MAIVVLLATVGFVVVLCIESGPKYMYHRFDTQSRYFYWTIKFT